ncbi:MAG TPA: hypothetical protein VGJ20_27430 [Xanthobacteraceae bacterium]
MTGPLASNGKTARLTERAVEAAERNVAANPPNKGMHMQETTSPGPEIFAFGPYKLSVAARLLEREGTPVLLGSRALDLLIVLA